MRVFSLLGLIAAAVCMVGLKFDAASSCLLFVIAANVSMGLVRPPAAD